MGEDDMSTLREAAQQALEALEETQRHRAHTQGIPDAITALRDALAQEDEIREMLRTLGFRIQCPESIGITLRRWRDGYAAALAQQEQQEQEPVDAEAALRCALAQRDWAFKQLQAQPNRREWQGLSEDENNELLLTMVNWHKSVNWLSRAIEAALKEKNNA
jgi:HD superfamily phosphohydrolase